MTDKNGKTIRVGDVVRTSDGRTVRVAGVLQSKFTLIKAEECDIINTFVGGKDAGDEEDGICWGS